MSENFSSILEAALAKPDLFIQTILPELEPLSENKLADLTSVLESGTVIEKQNITRLFVEYLKNDGAAYLTKRLDVKRPKLFIEAANIIGELRYEKALESLKAALKKEYSELVLSSIKAITLFPASKASIETLSNFYLTFEDEVLLSKSIRYLSTQSKELVPIFLGKYASLPVNRQMFLLEYFSVVADSRVEKLLIDEYNRFPDEKGVYCIDGLGRIGSDNAVNALAKSLETPEWFLRKHIVTALGVSKNANAIPPILKALDDSHVLVRGAAVKSLSQVGNKNPDLLIETLKTAKNQMKSNLVRAMGLLKNEKFVEPLTEVLKDKNALFYAIDAVGDLGFPQAEFALRRILKDDVWFNRLNALEALAKLNSREMKTFAQEASEDENDMVRNSAARILVALKTKQNQV